MNKIEPKRENFSYLKVQRGENGILWISLNRPEVKNALHTKLLEELIQIFCLEVLKDAIRLVVLQGEGSVFCAGGDLNEMKDSKTWTFEQNQAQAMKLVHCFSVIHACQKPVIAVVRGAVLGGGMGLISCCDVVIAEKMTVFAFPEVKLGLIPSCVSPFVIAKIGVSHARWLFMTRDVITAERAQQIGLVHFVESTQEGVQKRLDRECTQILQGGPEALRITKNLTRSVFKDLELFARMLAEVRISPEAQEGLQAFVEKRSPSWSHY